MNKGVLYVQYGHSGAYPPVLNSSRILHQNGWSVRMIGTQAADQDRFRIPDACADQVVLHRMPSQHAWLKFFFLWFSLRTARDILRSRANWVYASDPMVCVAVQWAMCWSKKRFLYHEHDSFNQNDPSKVTDRKTRMILRARNAVARQADFCVFPNRKRAEIVMQSAACERNPMVVWNCPSRNELDRMVATSDYRTNCDQPFHVIYCGSLNEVRFPFTYIDAMTFEPRARLTLVGYETIGSSGFSERLRRYASERHVADRMTLRDPVSRDAVFLELQRAHVAIATVPLRSDDVYMSGMLGASNKSFDGLGVGIPVLVSDLPDWREEFVDRGIALACDPGDPLSIASAWRQFADHPDRTRVMGERGRALIASEWNYESQFRPILESMNRLNSPRKEDM